MATLSNRTGGVSGADAPISKPPPLLQTGIAAWLRANLFKSTFDTILTIIAGGITLALLISILTWSVGVANWFVITQNLQQMMVGTFPRESLWRVNAAALACAFAIGFTLYAYTRPRRLTILALGVFAAVLIVAPPLIRMTTPPAAAYFAAGNVEIAAGTQTEIPEPVVGFVGRAGERVSVQLTNFNGIAPDGEATTTSIPPDDGAVVGIAGFVDRAASAVVNAASGRLTTLATIADLDARLAGDLLTANQRATLTEQRARLEAPPIVIDTYAVNRASVDVYVRVVNADGTLGDVVASDTLNEAVDLLEATLPADGWYALEKTLAQDSAAGTVAILRTTGIYPVLERNLSDSDGAGGVTRVVEYSRMTDRYETRALRPQIDGGNAPILVITDAQYRGIKPFSDYLRLYVAPFADLFAAFFLPMLIAGIGGYFGGVGVGIIARPASTGAYADARRPARAFVTWLWVLYLFALAFLVYGVQGLDALGLALLLGRFAWVGWAYYAGANAGRTFGAPALALVFALGIAQSVIAERIDLSAPPDVWIWKVFGVIVWLGIGVLAAQRGASQRDRIGESPAARGFVATSVLWIALLIVPYLTLNVVAGDNTNLLPIIDTQRWGGLLLTLLLTMVAIVASFPLGVLLALGRRSSLPVVKGTCIAFIEIVRGVPLITVLFMAQLLVPLVNPGLAEIENVFRAMVGLTLFSAAYLAENVRGGLQSVAGGQEEAARALGLQGWQITLFVTLPQALRAVLPALVGQCIALFKDTSLVALVGLLDLTGIARGIIAQSEFVGLQSEIFFFTSVIYFVFSYLMAAVSRRIESSGSGAMRRTL
jgi:general L-amino acid transport system permease protein